MKLTYFKRIFLIAAIGCCFFSCSSDLDFDQVKDLNLQPVFTTNLAYIEGTSSDFVSNGVEIPIHSDASNVDFFNSTFVEEDLVKAEMYFRIKNTLLRAYTYNVAFFDINNSLIYTIEMDVPASNGSEVIVEKTETFTENNISVLKNATTMVFSVFMLPGTPITETTPGRVEMSSGITVYFDVK